MTTAKPREQGESWRLVRAKSNIGPDGDGFEYSLEQVAVKDGVWGQAISWGEKLEGNARELLDEVEADNERDAPAVDDAVRWLNGLLSDAPFKQIAEATGRAWRTVKRAKAELGIESVKGGMKGGWLWQLPKGAKSAEGCQQSVVAPFEDAGPLRNGHGLVEVEI
jgi:putative DNA primase/helicase